MYKTRKVKGHVPNQESEGHVLHHQSERTCTKPGKRKDMYQTRKAKGHVSDQESERTCIKPGK
jgi:hypothetical protein